MVNTPLVPRIQTNVRAAIDNEIRWLRCLSWTDARLMDWLEGARWAVDFYAKEKAQMVAASASEGTGKDF